MLACAAACAACDKGASAVGGEGGGGKGSAPADGPTGAVAAPAGETARKNELPAQAVATKTSPAAEPTQEASAQAREPAARDETLEVAVDDATKAQAAGLAPLVEKEFKFPWDKRKPDNAKAFLYLAARGGSDDVVAAALYAMAETFGSGKELLSDDYKKVVRARLRSRSDVVVGGALAASKDLVDDEGKDASCAEAINEIVAKHSNPSARYEATSLLLYVYDSVKDPKTVNALLLAMDAPENYVRSAAINILQARQFQIGARRAEVLAAGKRLIGDPDPGVRGRALELVARMAKQDNAVADVASALVGRLDDESPFVRSVAARMLSWVDYRPAIDKIVTLMSDTAPNTYAIDVTTLAGVKTKQIHDGSNYSRVDDAMIWSIRDYSNWVGVKFTPGQRESGLSVEDWVAREKGAARKWVDDNRASL